MSDKQACVWSGKPHTNGGNMINSIINCIRDIISGKLEITTRIRFEIARVGVGFIHVVLIIAFSYIGCMPLVYFNCFSILFYIVIAEILILRQKYLTALACSYLEILIHSFFACIMLGWSFAFALYNIGLIYIAYYFCYFTTILSRKILFPTILGMISLTLTLGMRLYSYYHPPVYTEYSDTFVLIISIMNVVVSAAMIMFFAALHTIEIQRKAYQLLAINEKLDKMAHYDSLTKLRNRHSMEETLHTVPENGWDEHCFIMGDIDNFKQFNDTYGHACGDYVLQEVARIILKNMEDKHIACRWGGEEILMLIEGNIEYGRTIAEKIRYEIEHMNGIYHETPLHVTMTFGVAACTETQSFEKCIRKADKRLYQGKQGGKNCVIANDIKS